MMTQPRPVGRAARGVPTSDGAGVRMTRVISSADVGIIDPFLMLDEFRSDEPRDYLAGFPDHPHRGFDTVTYMLAGRMRHRDNHGHSGVIGPGGVQWMRAGRGIVHSEMPEQESGLMWGFQLWVNLPGREKMSEPGYQEFSAEEIPEEEREGCRIRVIAGRTSRGTEGAVRDIPTAPLYFDVHLSPGGEFEEPLDSAANACVYVYEGDASVVSLSDAPVSLARGVLGRLGAGDGVRLRAGDQGARLLLLAARPLNEPIAWQGPFVMNTREELFQAFEDYRLGRF
jgi:redox-sensitive bicupin YhaK (pirin superfamily)